MLVSGERQKKPSEKFAPAGTATYELRFYCGVRGGTVRYAVNASPVQ
jgi:hypothetical protein